MINVHKDLKNNLRVNSNLTICNIEVFEEKNIEKGKISRININDFKGIEVFKIIRPAL